MSLNFKQSLPVCPSGSLCIFCHPVTHCFGLMQGKTAQAPSGEQAEYARAFPDCKSHRTPLADSHCPDTGVRHGYIVCDAYSGRTSAYGQDVGIRISVNRQHSAVFQYPFKFHNLFISKQNVRQSPSWPCFPPQDSGLPRVLRPCTSRCSRSFPRSTRRLSNPCP